MSEAPCRNVFVPALDDYQLGELKTITDAKNIVFHQLLAPEEVRQAAKHGFHRLITRARDELKAFDGTSAANIAHWDFLASVRRPTLSRHAALRS